MSEQVKDGGLAVFSGKCLEALCGIATGHNDMGGKPLFTGDIVIIFTVRDYDNGDGCDYFPDGLTVVVSDEWTTYSGDVGESPYVRKDGDAEYFVMGIRSVPLEETGDWRVMKVKGHESVIAGEHWPAYGFIYAESPFIAARESTP